MTGQTTRVLKAVERLRRYYENREPDHKLPNCPLCLVARHVDGDNCLACPRVILQGAPNGPGYAACVEHISYVVLNRHHPTPQWRTASIKRLSRWRRQIATGVYEKRLRARREK